ERRANETREDPEQSGLRGFLFCRTRRRDMAKVMVEQKELTDMQASFQTLNKRFEEQAAEVTRLKAIAEQPASVTGATMAKLAAAPIDHKEEGKFGWKSMSEQLLAIKDVACNKATG